MPFALAMRRAVPDAVFLEVDGDATWTTPDGNWGARFPEVAKGFIEAFDYGDAVQPLAFECDPMFYERDYSDDGDDGDDA